MTHLASQQLKLNTTVVAERFRIKDQHQAARLGPCGGSIRPRLVYLD